MGVLEYTAPLSLVERQRHICPEIHIFPSFVPKTSSGRAFRRYPQEEQEKYLHSSTILRKIMFDK